MEGAGELLPIGKGESPPRDDEIDADGALWLMPGDAGSGD